MTSAVNDKFLSSYRADGQLSITALVLTFNEDIHIERCLKNAFEVAQRVIVVDSFSTDRTVEMARAFGAEIVQRAFIHQADQLQWALDNLDIKSDWVLRLDADEYLEPALVSEIRERLPGLPKAVAGIRMKRKLLFRDKWIRYGGYYPTELLRLWRRGQVRVQQLWMDEHIVLKGGGQQILFRYDFCDHNLRDVTWWTDKHNRYATRKMVDFITIEHGLRRDSGATDKARLVKQFLQYTLFRRTPLYLRAVLLFAYRYLLRLGFLDGKHGFVWHTLQGFWYAMLIDAKVEEARNFIAAHGIDAFKAHLADRHGIKL